MAKILNSNSVNWSEEVFVTKEIKDTMPWTYVICDLKGEKIVGTFYEKEIQTTSKKIRIAKVIKINGDMEGLMSNEKLNVRVMVTHSIAGLI